MPKLMLQSGKPASVADLMTDDDVIQMLKDSEEKGKKDAPTKETILQSLKVEDVPAGIKTELTKDTPTKEKIVQALTVEDVTAIPDVVKQKILEDAKVEPVVPEVIKNFAKQMLSAKDGGNGSVNDDPDKKTKPSASMELYQRLGR